MFPLRWLLNTSERLVWAAGEVGQEHVQISAAKLQVGTYALWMGRCVLIIQMCASVEAGPGALVDNRALIVELQPMA